MQLHQYNIHCFIEKPLGSSLKKLSKLELLLKKKKKIITMMGFQLRFNPLIEYLNKVIKIKSPIGKLLSANIHNGENIKDFHPYEDYRISYAAKKKLGGGVILSQIHEIDYFLYLFSNYEITNSTYISSKISDLDIDVEDIFSSNFLLNKNKSKLFCNINLNYFERPKKRKFYLIGSSGSLVACFNTQRIQIFKNGKKKVIKFNFKRNDISLQGPSNVGQIPSIIAFGNIDSIYFQINRLIGSSSDLIQILAIIFSILCPTLFSSLSQIIGFNIISEQ